MTDITFAPVDIDDVPPIPTCAFPGCEEPKALSSTGRQLKFCTFHGVLSNRQEPKQSRKTNDAEDLARQAAKLLSRLNVGASFAIMAFGLPKTAKSFADENATFEDSAYEALLLDPALCKKIVGVGGKSAGFALAACYALMFVGTVPVAFEEIAERREAARLEKERLDNAADVGT